MRRTSIIIEVSDDVYSEVVEPMKKSKSFSKLIASLLQGYVSDVYIRAYADDTLEDLRRASVSSFNRSIESMSESLSNMGLVTDELESISMSGKSKFSEAANRQKEEIFEDKRKSSESQAEIDALTKRIDDMQASFNSTLQSILDVMKNNQQPQVPNMMYGMPQVMYGMPMQGMGYGVPMQGVSYGVGIQGYSQQPNIGYVNQNIQQGQNTGINSTKGSEPLEVNKPEVKSANDEYDETAIVNSNIKESTLDNTDSTDEYDEIDIVNSNIKESTSNNTDSTDESDAWDSEAADFMASMLEGNSYSY